MLKNNVQNTQDEFLIYILKNEIKVRIFLANGIKLEGKIAKFDQHSLVLNNEAMVESTSILVYKHAISTIVPENNSGNVLDFTPKCFKKTKESV